MAPNHGSGRHWASAIHFSTMSYTAEDGTIPEALPGAQNRAGLTNSCIDVYINKGKEVITGEK